MPREQVDTQMFGFDGEAKGSGHVSIKSAVRAKWMEGVALNMYAAPYLTWALGDHIFGDMALKGYEKSLFNRILKLAGYFTMTCL